ncbi:MAG: type II toxin-antitoxin system RelE/ParE family toxin [Propionibacteriaceae bacterium]|nr:type II toxin-antitoxin system RelE/ParE family toxin [Propionibacteriaceae bacterium]
MGPLISEYETENESGKRSAHVSLVKKATDSLTENPRPHGVKKLSGRDQYRISVKDYRIIYTIQDNILLVRVIAVGHRSKIYRSKK